MTLNTLDEVKAAMTVTVTDARLTAILALTENEITEVAGVDGARTEWPEPAQDFLMLSRASTAIGSIVEHVYGVDTTLATDDWRLSNTAQGIYRLDTGTHPAACWAQKVSVTFTPRLTTALRKAVQLDLVELDLKGPAEADLEKLGEWEERSNSASRSVQRQAILVHLTAGWIQ